MSSRNPKAAARKWKFASGFLALLTFTTIVGYYVPLRRKHAELTEAKAALEQQLASELSQVQGALKTAEDKRKALARELDTQNSAMVEVKQRIAQLVERLERQFSKLKHAEMLTVSSAGDRVSVAVKSSVLFPKSRTQITKNGRILLCQLSKILIGEFAGQIRVTGYYGKSTIDDRLMKRDFDSTWELSSSRAAAAADTLERRCGAPVDRFFVVGYGPRPAGPLGENVAFEFVVKPGE